MKATQARVARIRHLAASGWGCVKLQRYFGLSRSQIRRLCDQHDIRIDSVRASQLNIGSFVRAARSGAYTPPQLAKQFCISKERVLQLCDDYEINLPLEPVREKYDWLEPPQPAQATAILPGPAKVEILRQRVERGEGLWHPNDVDYEGWRGGA